MSPIFRANHVEVTNRLAELGWRQDQLLEVVDAMVAARNSCTENDPLPAPGWMSWKEGTRRLREIGRPMGLEKDETDQIPSVIDRKRALKFAVSNTDDGTGIQNRIPQNRNRKGPGTDRAVCDNQGSFLDVLDASVNVISIATASTEPDKVVSWYLCVFCDGDDVRAELSCPVGWEGGYFTDFAERIVLVGPEDDRGVKIRRNKPDDSSEFDIPVSRK